MTTRPADVTSVDVTYVDDTHYTLTWIRHPATGAGYDTIETERWDTHLAVWDDTLSMAGSATSKAVTGSANKRYRWRVRARNSAGVSGWTYSEYLQTTPSVAIPTATKETIDSIKVAWTHLIPSLDYEWITEVDERVNGGAWVNVASFDSTVDGFVFNYTATGLVPGSYEYRTRAISTVDVTLSSAYTTTSAPVVLIGAPELPGGFSILKVSDTHFELGWSNNDSTYAPYDSIVLQRWDNVSNLWGTLATLGPTVESFTDTSTIANRKYSWRIHATNSTGLGLTSWRGGDTVSPFTTTPARPSAVNANYTGGTTMAVSWVNGASYVPANFTVTPYANSVAGTPVTVTGTTTTYTATGIDPTKTYFFKVKAVHGSMFSAETQSNTVIPAAAPNAPLNLAPVTARDLAKAVVLTWTHSPTDGSAQTQFDVRHRQQGSSTWVTSGPFVSSASTWTLPAGTYTNPHVVEWQVRTWGVFASPGSYSATAAFTGSATPTATIVTPGSVLASSQIVVDWTYGDAESTAQAEWEVTLYNAAGTIVLEQQTGIDTATIVTLDTPAEDDVTYVVKVRVRDGSGLWSDLASKTFTADYLLPAEVLLTATYDEDSGSMVLTLTPTADDGGITTLPASSVTIERQVYDVEDEQYGDWEVVADNLDPTATVVDTSAPINDDGYYRATTYSAAPSIFRPADHVYSVKHEDKWIVVSGGDNLDVICRMWANIEISRKASRSKALHYFAGRARPVLYSGESTDKAINVSGLVTDDGRDSTGDQWLRLARQAGPVLLRAPGPHRMFGSLSEVSVERIQRGLQKISFTVTEVSR